MGGDVSTMGGDIAVATACGVEHSVRRSRSFKAGATSYGIESGARTETDRINPRERVGVLSVRRLVAIS